VMITGVKPERTPSLSDDAAAFQTLVAEVWSKPNVSGEAAADLLGSAGVEPDAVISGNHAEILYVHRNAPGIEIYWLDNRSADYNQAEISFRVNGLVPMIWHPETGETMQVPWKIQNKRTLIPLGFEPWEAYFIVFSGRTGKTEFELADPLEESIGEITGPWTVNFQQDRGAPESAEFASLLSWPEHEDSGIGYFSGTASYQNTFQLDQPAINHKLMLDLGEVKQVAEVIVNGQNLGVLWNSPFKLDISGAVKEGENTLEIRVTNVWVNRLVGDAQPGAEERFTFTTMPFYRADSPLLPSGLLGPVTLIKVTQ